jgi:hypothetical protein
MPVFRNYSQANRTSENGLLGGERVTVPPFLRRAHAQSGFKKGRRRMQGDQKAYRLDIASGDIPSVGPRDPAIVILPDFGPGLATPIARFWPNAPQLCGLARLPAPCTETPAPTYDLRVSSMHSIIPSSRGMQVRRRFVLNGFDLFTLVSGD